MIFLIIGIVLGILIPIGYLVSIADVYDKYKSNEKRNVKVICIFIFVICIGLGYFASTVVIVPAGAVGVHDLFGQVTEREYNSGFNMKHPLAHVEIMNIKTQEYTMSNTWDEGAKAESDVIPTLSKEGLYLELDITILYRIQSSKADEIYKTVGTDYVNVIVRPQIRTAIRDVVARHEAKQVYGEERQTISLEIFDEMKNILEERGIILESVLLRNVKLPPELSKTIEQKLNAEQNIQKKEFEVEEAKQEANRKRVEAQGIADANDIISLSLTENYLRWYWIENLDTHESVIYVPVGEGDMPIFKDVDNTE